MAVEGVRAHVIVHGRVYGVHFGGTVVSQAARLGLGGWVKEYATGRVEFVVEGPKDDVDEILEWAEEDGPPSARVESVEVVWEEPSGEFLSFELRE